MIIAGNNRQLPVLASQLATDPAPFSIGIQTNLTFDK